MLLCALILSPVTLLADGNEAPGGVAGIAAMEAQKRQHQVKAAQTLFTAGSQAYGDGSYGEAMDNFKAAFITIPPVPAVADQRRAFFRRYQSAAVRFTEVKIEEARWAEAEQTLEDVMTTAKENGIPVSIIDPDVRRLLGELKSRDGRFNMATSPQHLGNVDAVKNKLVLAKGYLELGDYDRAERTYNEVLGIDPYSEAARIGLEKVERHRLDYYDAAYNHSRSRMLREVAEGWETPIQKIGIEGGTVGLPTETATSGSVAIQEKLRRIVIPRIDFNNARLVDVVTFLTQKSQELDTSEPDPSKKGVSILIDSSTSGEGANMGERPLTVRLSNVPLASALQYVTELVGTKYRVEEFAVVIVPESEDVNATLQTRTYPVPPGFISSEAPGADPAANDPFAAPDDNSSGILVKRISAKDFLEKNGILFGEGASANYNPSTSILMVRNTAEQLLNVETLIQSARESGDKMVQIRVKIVSIEDIHLKQMGLDWLLGTANVGSTPRVFFGGGTDGNAATATLPQDYPFVVPGGGPIGLNPVSGGLRTGDLASTQTIDDIINRANAGAVNQKAPGIFSIAGVFTDPQFQMVLRALNQNKGADFLNENHVLVKPGQIAKIEQIREFIYPTEYDPPELPNNIGQVQVGGLTLSNPTTEFPVTPATPTAFETRGLGSIIEVEPTVSADNLSINVNVLVDFSDFAGFINYGTPIRNSQLLTANGDPLVVTENRILMPVFDSVKETTNVTVWDGQTIAIGGYHGQSITSSQDKVPGLGDLPGVGRAFRSSTRDSNRRAIVLFVSVKLVDPGGNPINVAPEDTELASREPAPPRSFTPVGPPTGQSGAVYPAK